MDEAHLLKDRTSSRSKRLRDIAQKAKQRVMLTGTPLQNDLQVIHEPVTEVRTAADSFADTVGLFDSFAPLCPCGTETLLATIGRNCGRLWSS